MQARIWYIVNLCSSGIIASLITFSTIEQKKFTAFDLTMLSIIVAIFSALILFDIIGLRLKRHNERGNIVSKSFRITGKTMMIINLLLSLILTYLLIYIWTAYLDTDALTKNAGVIIFFLLWFTCIISTWINCVSFSRALSVNKKLYYQQTDAIGEHLL